MNGIKANLFGDELSFCDGVDDDGLVGWWLVGRAMKIIF